MGTIALPGSIYESGVLPFVELLSQQNDEQLIVVDWGVADRYCPAAVVALLSTVHTWIRLGKRVEFANLRACPALKYLQRMDFFRHCQIGLEEEFTRHEPDNR